MHYVLWNAKLGGWLSRSGMYTSDLSQARTFSRDEARTTCARAYNAAIPEFGLIPVELDFVREFAV